MDSILTSVKKMLGLPEEYTPFDIDIILHINTVFSILSQMGIGPKKTFSIFDETKTWDEFLEEKTDIDMVKSYMYLKVRLLFDPPTNTGAMEAMNNMIKELEFRLFVAEDNKEV